MLRPLDYAPEELATIILASHPAGVRKRQHQESPHPSAVAPPIGRVLDELRDLPPESGGPVRDQSLSASATPTSLSLSRPACH
jgi:hypothetical protein